jgi:hypothetical protein
MFPGAKSLFRLRGMQEVGRGNEDCVHETFLAWRESQKLIQAALH